MVQETETKVTSTGEVAMEEEAPVVKTVLADIDKAAAAEPASKIPNTATTLTAADPDAAGSSSSAASAPVTFDGANKEECIKKALNALVQGKRHYLMKDTPLACSALGEACRILAEVHGPLSTENGYAEAHFFYGKALLDQARLDLAVFDAPPAGGDAKSGDEDTEESDEEEGDGDGEGTTEDGEGDESNAEKMDAAVSDEKDDDKDAKEDDAEKMEAEVSLNEEDINVPSPGPGPATNGHSSALSTTTLPLDDEKPGTSKGVTAGDAEENAEEELSNLELAWEVFEIAKLGYMKQIEAVTKTLEESSTGSDGREALEKSVRDLKSKLAETHSLLGEVGTESEIYTQAIEDFKTALAMYTEFDSADSRDIAQVHFHMGIAHSLAKNYQDSVDSLRQSVIIIKQRIQNLKNKQVEEKKSQNEVTTTTPSNAELNGESLAADPLEKEIQELTELVPELEEKINDTLEQERDAEKVAEEEKKEEEMIQRNSPVKNPNPPIANDISHLVKKRKKVELEEPTGAGGPGNIPADSSVEPPSKKACTNLTFIEKSTTTSSNGHSVKEVTTVTVTTLEDVPVAESPK